MKGLRFVRIGLCYIASFLILCAAAYITSAQRTEYRAFWVDTFNTTLNNHTDVVNVVNNAKAAKANAIFAQVRRRGDSWYLNSREPAPDFVPIAAGFDPLADLIAEAHLNDIEVHAFVIASAVWNKNPTFAPSATLGPPTNPNHVFNLHGWDPVTRTMRTGADNWLTKSLIPDGTAGIAFQGQRFGSDFWLDFGHPDAAAYTVDVLSHLVSKYDIDGLHLDRIRYPEFSIAGQTPSSGTSIGYNAVSVNRFNARYGRTGNPAQNDPLWNQWRRDQVSNVVRRIYLTTIDIKPQIKISAALIAFGGGPVCPFGQTCANDKEVWEKAASAEAYWRVYQDWRSWTEEGILDIAMPMNYKREHISSQEAQFNSWNEWTKNHQYNRSALIGVGNFLNSVEGSIRQVRRSLQPSAQGNRVKGVIFFSMATSNVFTSSNGVTPVVNPYSVPPNQFTPTRSFAEFASGLTTGKSVDGTTLYEPDANAPGFTAIFSEAATIPVLPWKETPTKGHLMGFAKRANSTVLDTADVTITRLGDNTTRSTATDGGGFYGGVDLVPGEYLVEAVLGPDTYSCLANVSAGQVTNVDETETVAPVTSAVLTPSAPNGLNGWYTTNVSLDLSATDSCSGVAATEYSTDGGATWTPYSGTVTLSSEGTTTVLFRSTDRAGNTEIAQSFTVKIDKTAPVISLSADPSQIWPPDGRSVSVTLTGNGSDAISGLSQATYTVTDEYGSALSVPTRALTGASMGWIDTLAVEARRLGEDLDGRLYRVTVTVADAAGNTSTATVDIIVPHDQGVSP